MKYVASFGFFMVAWVCLKDLPMWRRVVAAMFFGLSHSVTHING